MSENDLAPAKALEKFAKVHKQMELIAGIYEGKVIDQEECIITTKVD